MMNSLMKHMRRGKMKELEDAKKNIELSEKILKRYKTNLKLVEETGDAELIREYKIAIATLKKNTERLKEVVIELERELQQRN